MSRQSIMIARANQMGLCFGTWSPGDEKTRYRFFLLGSEARALLKHNEKHGVDSVFEGNYFSDDGLYTALGIKEAETFLSGVSVALYRMNEA